MEYIFLAKGHKINDELLDKFVECVNQPHEKIKIYLESNGGEGWTSDLIVDIINSNPERFKLIATNGIFSAAFVLFFNCKCERQIVPGTIGMIHQSSVSLDMNDRLRPTNVLDAALKKRIQNFYYPDGLDFIKRIGLNKKEIKKYKKGHDVYFQPDRLLELFNNQVK